jgi:DNA repair exonuclease SbcCD nuclease subunit
MKILHTADWHADANPKEFKNVSGFLIEKAREEEPDLIIIAGDVFDSRDIKLDSEACKEVFKVVHELAGTAPVAIITGTPRHEGTATESIRFASAFEHNITVSVNPRQFYLHRRKIKPLDLIGEDVHFGLREKNPDAIISMIPTPTKQFMQGTDDEISQALTPIFAGFGATASDFDCPHILVYHGTIAGATLANGQDMTGRDISISKDQIALGNFDLVCCGHIHLPQEIKPNIFYSGSLGALNFGEDHNHGFYLHEIEKNRPSIEPSYKKYCVCSSFMKTPSRKLIKLESDFTRDDGINVLYPIAPDEIKNGSIKVTLKAWQDDANPMLNKEKIEEYYKSAGAAEVKVDIKRMPREVVRSEQVTQLESLVDKIKEQAKIKAESLPEGIIEIAADLETLSDEEIYEKVKSGYTYRSSSQLSTT